MISKISSANAIDFASSSWQALRPAAHEAADTAEIFGEVYPPAYSSARSRQVESDIGPRA
jgi:hypothetical protein